MDRKNSNDRTTAGAIAATAIIATIALLALAGLGGVSCAAEGENAGGSEGEMTRALVSAASVTDSINYQGRLTDSSGSPLTGTYGITFRLYDVSTGGTALATDIHDVVVTDGLFNTGIDFGAGYFDGRELWLGVKVGADSEMTPRQELRPVPYALSLRPGAVITSSGPTALTAYSGPSYGIQGWSLDNIGLLGISGSSYYPPAGMHGVHGVSETGVGVYGKGGHTGVYGNAMGNDGVGVYGRGNEYGGFFTTNQGGTSWDDHNAGVNATTTHDYSDGVYAKTTGYGSDGVHVVTRGNYSDGVHVYTEGDDSGGVYAKTEGDYSDGFFANTCGYESEGVYVITRGNNSDGVRAYTIGYGSDGVYADTYGDYSNGVRAYTTGDESDGVFIWTTGDYSDGVDATTTGYGSEGVDVATYGDYSYGVHVNTTGDGSDGVYAKTAGDYSYGVRAWTTGVGSDGVYAYSEKSDGVYAYTGRSDHNYGVRTPNKMYASYGYDTYSTDVAEYFPTPEDSEPGTVMVIDPAGGSKLRASTNAYDTTVAGIVSTAPGVSLGTKEDGNDGEKLIAVAGRVPCKIDASYAAIKPGDLLTTSDTPGHAMKATNPVIGTILGKALESLDAGTGTIEVLVTLQ